MTDEKNTKEDLKELLKDKTYLQIPKMGDLVKGAVLAVSKSEIKIDLPGYRTGVVRGNELYAEGETDFKVGDEIETTVVDLENENGEVELSLRSAGQQRTWDNLNELRKSNQRVKVKILEANKGGLIVKLSGINGFIPVSQLSPDNYPRVQGGDKSKILERLRQLVGKEIDVKVLDAIQSEGKLIVSEKQVWEEDKKENIAKYKVGDTVEGEITAVTDFGVFLKFDDLEGLIHISELAWQRIDHPSSLFRVGDKAKAVIVNISGSRIFLSTKKLQEDPWSNIAGKYHIGDKVKGKVLKTNSFGVFVELDKDIHGLAHISALGKHKMEDIKAGDEMEFFIISMDIKEHRLGLSLGEGAATAETKTAEAKTEEKKEKKPAKKTVKKAKDEEKPADEEKSEEPKKKRVRAKKEEAAK
jgi:small subunit ribosomal protein S1